MNHIKPSREELQASIDAAAQELESTPPQEVIEEEEPTVTPPETPEEPEEEEEQAEESEHTPEDVDYKKKFSESSREAQIQSYKNKELNKAIKEASELPDPTEAELLKEYPEWEDMTATEQRLAKNDYINTRRFRLIEEATQKFAKVDEWNAKVDTFLDDPKTFIAYPELEGKLEEFKLFSSKPTRRGLDFEDLVLAFNGDLAKNKPKPKKGQMFESGSGGRQSAAAPKDDKLSVEEGRKLMKADFPKFKQLLKEGKIRNE